MCAGDGETRDRREGDLDDRDREDREARIERAWERLRQCVEGPEGDRDVFFRLRFGAVGLAQVERCFHAIEKRDPGHLTSSVWARPGDFDPAVAGVDPSLEALAAGKLAAVSIHYDSILRENSAHEVTFALVLTVTRLGGGDLRARADTRSDFFSPRTANVRERFGAFAAHGLELAALLGVPQVTVGIETGGGGEGVGSGRWVGV